MAKVKPVKLGPYDHQCECGEVYTQSYYCITQLASGVSVKFTCPKCGAVTEFWP